MTSSRLHKKSFFLQFILYFSGCLIILGVIQATIGTIRLYNESEQEYEKLTPDIVYPASTETVEQTAIKVPKKNTETQNNIYYVAEKKDEKSQQTASESTNQQENQQTSTIKKEDTKKTTPVTTKKIPPVIIATNPEKKIPPTGYKETIWTVITGKYFSEALWKFPIIIDMTRTEPRGQMYNESISLGTGMTSLSEVSKVLVHEIGHMIDIYTLKKNLRTADPSQDFYNISWKDPATIKAGIPKTAFISGYAATNQYEDFAESFAMYIFHNKEFQRRASENEYLKRKYDFLQSRIFGEAFLGSEYEKETIPTRVWDVTKIALRSTSLDIIFAWIGRIYNYKS